MRKIRSRVIAAVLTLLMVFAATAGCSSPRDDVDNGKPLVVVTLSFFEDMAGRIGGDRIIVKALVPVGVEPEEYEPLPSDRRAMEDACVFIYNGHNIERWLPRIAPGIEERPNSFALAEDPRIETIPLPSGPYAGMPDPHVWTNVTYAVIYVEQIAGVLAGIDPPNAAYFEERAQEYIAELEELDGWIREQVALIPPGRRLLVTSELCFQYYAAAYGFEHDAIWSINAAEEGSPSQITRIVNLVREKGVPAVFVENQVDHRPMQQVSRETGVPIGGVLFSDSLSKPGGGAETYIDMMKVNTKLILEALTGEDGEGS